MSTLAIVQARWASQRFPGKALADLHGQPVIWHVLMRAQAIPVVDRVVLALAESDRDTPLGQWALTHAPGTVRFVDRPVEDVLGRFAEIVRAEAPQYVCRVTGDCPALEPDVCARVWQFVQVGGCDYAWTDTASGAWPDGLDVEVMTAEALLRADADTPDAHDREHVTSWIRRYLRVRALPPDPTYHGLPKVSIDTPEDLCRIRAWMPIG